MCLKSVFGLQVTFVSQTTSTCNAIFRINNQIVDSRDLSLKL